MHAAPVTKDLVLIGGGHAHVHVLKSFAMRPMPGVRLTLIARDIETPYSGMIPGFIAGHYSREDCHIDLGPPARSANARLIHDEAVGIDLENRRVRLKSRPTLPFDVLSVDIGSTPDMSTIPGAGSFAIPVKPIDRLAARWQQVVDRVAARRDGPLRFVTVGGGAAGVELTLAARHRLRALLLENGRNPDDLSFSIVTRGELLETHAAGVRRMFRKELSANGISLSEHATVTEVRDRMVVTAAGAVPFDELFWVTQAGAAQWLTDTGLDLDGKGFILVDRYLRSTNSPAVFAVGDVATSAVDPRPKAGVFAVRQGPPLSRNLRAALAGQPLRPFKPQKHFLSLISTGDKRAVASRGSIVLAGAAMWRLKDWIDRRFMATYRAPANMNSTGDVNSPDGDQQLAKLKQPPMRCGGCGAKIGASSLSRVLQRLSPRPSPHAVIGMDAPDDAAVVTAPPGRHLVQTVDFFRSFTSDPYVFGRIAATHALGDVYAMGGTPLTALATATIPYAAPDKVEEDLFQMLRGALDVLEADGCTLVGGHSAESAELALGFAVNGSVDPERMLRKGGIRPGDALILTKPLGTGALLAADMRGKARAPWIEAALASMQHSNRAAAQVMVSGGARACTDVTGFGLLGHLHEMLMASGADAVLALDDVPLLNGAREVTRLGIASSLTPDNLRLRRVVEADHAAAAQPAFSLLFDPQTAGGLLAAVPPANAAAVLHDLRTAGYAGAAIIGRATAMREDRPTVIVKTD